MCMTFNTLTIFIWLTPIWFIISKHYYNAQWTVNLVTGRPTLRVGSAISKNVLIFSKICNFFKKITFQKTARTIEHLQKKSSRLIYYISKHNFLRSNSISMTYGHLMYYFQMFYISKCVFSSKVAALFGQNLRKRPVNCQPSYWAANS